MKTTFLFKNLSSLLGMLILSVLVFTAVRCGNPPVEGTPPLDESYMKKLITHEDAQILFDEYSRTNNKVLTDSRNGNPDSRWYSFTIEEMEGYIQYVKKQAKEQNIKNVGIKIYMGKYPVNQPAEKMAKPEFGGYQTIFLMPTAKKQGVSDASMKSSRTTEEDEKIESIQPMNMTNLSPPPNNLSANTLN